MSSCSRGSVVSVGLGLGDVFAVLDRLHRPKDRAYGDARRKRGEVLGIFANIARKFDRLVVALNETGSTGVESLGDTVADLTVYAGKYVTWLAELYPRAFDSVGAARPAARCAAVMGPDSLTEVFAVVGSGQGFPAVIPLDTAAAARGVSDVFSELEKFLMAQADGATALPADQKLWLALELTWASAWLLVRLADHQPSLWGALQDEITAIEERS
jgi:hypothetical protein